MTLNLKKALLAGTAIVAVGAFATINTANAQALTTSGTAALADNEYQTADGADVQANPVINIDDATVLTFVNGLDDNNNGTNADNNVVNITAANGGVIINDGVTLTQSVGAGDVITTTGDIAGVAVTVNGVLAASANTEHAINFSSLGAANGATINVNGGAATDGNVTGLITGGAGADLLNVNTTDGAATFDGAIDLGGGADVVTITSTAANKPTFAALTADTITLTGGSTAAFGGAVTGNIGLNTSSIAEVAAGQNITGTVDNVSGSNNAGELILAGATTVSGVVGGTNSLSVVSIGNGTGTFSETVNANTIDFDNDNGVAAFAKSVTATTLSFDGYTGTVTLADDANFTGNIDNSFPTGGTSGAATTAGTLTLTGTSTVSGTVGATNQLAAINAGGTGEVATFSSAVKAAAINTNGTGTVNLNGATTTALIDFGGGAGTVNLNANTNATTINFNDDDGTLAIADGVNVTASIVDTSDDLGTVNFAGSSTVTGNVGVVNDDVKIVNFNGGAGKTVTVSGTIAAVDVKVAGAGTVNANGAVTGNVDYDAGGVLNLADGVNVTGTVGVSTADQGTLNIAGTSTLSSTLNAGGFELATLNLNGTNKTVNVTGAVIAANATNIGYNTLAGGAAFAAEADDTLSFTIAGDTEFGKITSVGQATINADTTINLNVDTTEFIADGTDYVLIDGNGGTNIATLNAGKIIDDSVLLSFAQQTPGGEDLTVRASRAAVSSVTSDANTGALSAMLLANSGDAGLAPVQGYFQAATSADNLVARTEAVSAPVDGAAFAAGTQAGGQSFSTTNSRIQVAMNGDSDTGMVAGQMGEGVGVWGKAFGQIANQDNRDGVSGYDADTFGVAVGIDSENMIRDGLVGVSLSYANTDVESDNLTTTDTDVDSYQLSLYGSKALDQGMYVSGMLGYAWNDVDQTRNNVLGVAGNNANSDYDGNQYMAYAEFGKDYMMNGMTLTPKVLANYVHSDFDGYTESGSTANVTAGSSDVDVFELGIGARAEWDFMDNSGNSIKPSLTAEYRYDVIGDEVQTTSTFTGGGAAFQTEGFDPAQSSFLVGTGVQYDISDHTTISADYGYQFKSDYDAHNLSIRAGMKF